MSSTEHGNSTSGGRATVTLPSATEILITRTFAAPRHLVFRAVTTPDLVRRWWAGKRGDVSHAGIDLRVGGTWRFASANYAGAAPGETRPGAPTVEFDPDSATLPPQSPGTDNGTSSATQTAPAC